MVVIRFLFGVGEAGCFPIIAKSFTTWLPRSERTRAQGLLWMAARWGGAFTPLLVVWVLQFVNWRMAFVLFGLLGIVWAVVLLPLVSRQSARPSRASTPPSWHCCPTSSRRPPGTADVPWRRLLTSRVRAAARRAVLLPVVRLVLLPDLAADLPPGTSSADAQRRAPPTRSSRCSSTALARSSAAWSRPTSPGSPATTCARERSWRSPDSSAPAAS